MIKVQCDFFALDIFKAGNESRLNQFHELEMIINLELE